MSVSPTSLPSEETAAIEFKDSFDGKCWSELIKDIVAVANSGGGVIYVGLFDDGRPSGADVSELLNTDQADVVNKIRAVTDVNFSAFQISRILAGSAVLALIEVNAAATILVFNKAGNYVDPSGKSKSAFQQGTVYVRHGPKSEPATTDDLRNIIEARVAKDRQALLANLRQVVEAPSNAVVSIGVSLDTTDLDEITGTYPVRIVDESGARPAIILDPNKSHPHRQKEVVESVNQRLQGGVKFTTNDNVAIRRFHGVDADKRYYFKSKTGSPQYSDAYVDWIVAEITSDQKFLPTLRDNYHQIIVKQNAQRKAAQYR